MLWREQVVTVFGLTGFINMGTPAISHYRYDLDRHASELNRIAILASTYFIEDPSIRHAYIKDISDFIADAYRIFNGTFDPNEKSRVVYDVKNERDAEERDYQKFRMGNYVKRIVTEIYEEQGVFKYAAVATDVVSSAITMYGGYSLYNSGKTFNSNKLKVLGVTLMAHAGNDVFEKIAPFIVDHQESGVLRDLYRYGAKMFGYDKYTGDLSYSTGKLALSIYAGAYGFQKVNNRNSLLSFSAFERVLGKRDTGKLYIYVTRDFATKWSSKPTPMKIIFVGQQLYKAKIELYDGNYKFNGE